MKTKLKDKDLSGILAAVSLLFFVLSVIAVVIAYVEHL